MRYATLILLAACSPYEPDLSNAPFYCGDSEPRCPKGYTCSQAGSDGEEICLAPNSAIPIDALSCHDDQTMEPNNTLATAFNSNADTMKTVDIANLAICPPGDKDPFEIGINADMENVELVVTNEIGGAILEATILNEGGVPIATGEAVTATTIRAYATKLPIGTYYAQVQDTDRGTNNYALTIKITGP
jgi:hypothetical protein